MHLAKKRIRGISTFHPLRNATIMDKERLEKLVQKIRDGTETKEERDEVIIGHIRLIIQIATRYAIYRRDMIDDMISEGFETIIRVVGFAKDRLRDNNITPFIVSHVHGAISRLLEKERLTQTIPLEFPLPYSKTNIYDMKDEIYACGTDAIDVFIIDMRFNGYERAEIASFLKVSLSKVQKKIAKIEERYNKMQSTPN